MKAYDFSHWNLDESKKGLLFFAQSLEEMLWHYGHDSLKAPALNFRFLCIEIQNTIQKINDGILDQGNMSPLFEELKNSFYGDPIAKTLFGDDFDSLFFNKNAAGEIQRNCSELYKNPGSEASLKKIEHVIDYLLNEMDLNDKYYVILQDSISNIIKVTPFTIEEEESLYQLCRILVTELINSSYSQEYIYLVVDKIFYNTEKPIDQIDGTLTLFWSAFNFTEEEYVVTLPLKQSSLKKHLSHFENVSIKDNTQELFGNSCKWVVELTLGAMDPYKAQSLAIAFVNFLVSLIQYNNHKSKPYIANEAIVEQKSTAQIYNLQSPTSPLKRVKSLSYRQNTEKIGQMVKNYSFSPSKLINVIELHSSAINSSEIGNQLLNLWTIIEVLVPTEHKNSFAKINQICNIVTSVLNSQYIQSLITQLLIDLHHCSPDILSEQISQVIEGKSEIEKLIAVLVLSKYETHRTNIINSLNCYPLLQYRIEYYTNIFSNRISIKKFLNTHRIRLAWHIMRIYRNRNMIVHDGTHFPYIDIIVQNLHYYVDQLIDTINKYGGYGYPSIDVMYTDLQQKEYQYLLALEEKSTDGTPKKIDLDFQKIVLGHLE